MQLFYSPNIKGNTHILDELESKHAIKVLRLIEGDSIRLIDGKGGFYEAEITMAHHKSCELKITSVIQKYGERNFQLHLAIAPTKNIDRFEFFLEKATEIGIDKITPILCEHSERKILKNERLNKILVSAMKQSLKAYLPNLEPLTPFNEFIKRELPTQKFIAHCEERSKILLKNAYIKQSNAVILIGPEGDFSEPEIDLALANKFKEISLGENRLRTETAGIVACHTVNLINE